MRICVFVCVCIHVLREVIYFLVTHRNNSEEAYDTPVRRKQKQWASVPSLRLSRRYRLKRGLENKLTEKLSQYSRRSFDLDTWLKCSIKNIYIYTQIYISQRCGTLIFVSTMIESDYECFKANQKLKKLTQWFNYTNYAINFFFF